MYYILIIPISKYNTISNVTNEVKRNSGLKNKQAKADFITFCQYVGWTFSRQIKELVSKVTSVVPANKCSC